MVSLYQRVFYFRCFQLSRSNIRRATPVTQGMDLHTVAAASLRRRPPSITRMSLPNAKSFILFFNGRELGALFAAKTKILLKKSICVWITLSENTHAHNTHRYMRAHTRMPHLHRTWRRGRPTHVGGFATVIRLIGSSLLGNVA